MIRFFNAINCFAILLLSISLVTCGTKDAKEIQFSLSFPAGYDVSRVTDVVYYLINISAEEQPPLVYPSECTRENLVSGCGFEPGEEGNLVLCFDSQCNGASATTYPITSDKAIQLLYCARDEDTRVIYKGISQNFYNSPELYTMPITITIEDVGSLVDCREVAP